MKTPEGQPSGPAIVIALNVLSDSGWDRVEEKARAKLLMGIKVGYSIRMELAEFGAYPVPVDPAEFAVPTVIADLAALPVDEEGIGTPVSFVANDQTAVLAQLEPVIEAVRALVEERFQDVASVEPRFWNAVASVATYQLQRNLGRLFQLELAATVLRWGYVLRVMDEAVGIGAGFVPAPQPR